MFSECSAVILLNRLNVLMFMRMTRLRISYCFDLCLKVYSMSMTEIQETDYNMNTITKIQLQI